MKQQNMKGIALHSLETARPIYSRTPPRTLQCNCGQSYSRTRARKISHADSRKYPHRRPSDTYLFSQVEKILLAQFQAQCLEQLDAAAAALASMRAESADRERARLAEERVLPRSRCPSLPPS